MTIIATAFRTFDPTDLDVVRIVELNDDTSTVQWLTDQREDGLCWEFTHGHCGCHLADTDCCDGNRWECQTVKVLDSNGDVDVVVCMEGFGCAPSAEEKAARHA